MTGVEIKNSSISKALGLYSKAANTTKKAEEKQDQGKVNSSNKDTVLLSKDGPRAFSAEATSASIAAEIDAPASDIRLAELREKIENGEYSPTLKDVAKAILNIE